MKKIFVLMLLIAVTLAAIALTACSSGPEEATIVLEEVWARPGQMKMAGEGEEMDMDSGEGGMAMAGTSAIFMVIRNDGQEDDRLTAVSGDAAEFVEIHTTETRDGVTMMAQIPGIDIPGGEEVVLERGGLHIMLINLKENLDVGDTVTVELVFEKSGPRTVTAEVRAP